MALTTYSELQSAIADYLDRDDLTSQIKDFITLAETRHKREIRIREMITRSTSDASARFLALPSNFLEMRTLRLLTDPVTVLEQVNFDEMNRIRKEETGTPGAYTIHEEIEFNKIPSETFTAEMIYFAAFSALSDANTTNGLLTRSPDVYLYGALVASAPFLMNDERLQIWNNMYVAARDELNGSDARGRKTGPLFSRVVGATP